MAFARIMALALERDVEEQSAEQVHPCESCSADVLFVTGTAGECEACRAERMSMLLNGDLGADPVD